MAVIVLTVQIRAQALGLQATRALILLISGGFGFFDVYPVLPLHASFKLCF